METTPSSLVETASVEREPILDAAPSGLVETLWVERKPILDAAPSSLMETPWVECKPIFRTTLRRAATNALALENNQGGQEDEDQRGGSAHFSFLNQKASSLRGIWRGEHSF